MRRWLKVIHTDTLKGTSQSYQPRKSRDIHPILKGVVAIRHGEIIKASKPKLIPTSRVVIVTRKATSSILDQYPFTGSPGLWRNWNGIWAQRTSISISLRSWTIHQRPSTTRRCQLLWCKLETRFPKLMPIFPISKWRVSTRISVKGWGKRTNMKPACIIYTI